MPSKRAPTGTLKYSAIFCKVPYFGIEPFFQAVTLEELKSKTFLTNSVGVVLLSRHSLLNCSKKQNHPFEFIDNNEILKIGTLLLTILNFRIITAFLEELFQATRDVCR